VTLNGLRRLGWKQTPSGWLVEASEPLTSEQIVRAREFAADAGLTIETRRESSSTTPIAIATAAGALLALAILAMTVGLVRSESAGDLSGSFAGGARRTAERRVSRDRVEIRGVAVVATPPDVRSVAGGNVVFAATCSASSGRGRRSPRLPLAEAEQACALRDARRRR
jgi:hypothetical protein